MSYNSDLQRNNDALRGILDSVNELPEAQPVDDRFRRWNITTSGAVSNNRTALVADDWLRDHRQDADLVVVMVPKFTITADPSGTNNYLGIYVCSNRAMMANGAGELFLAFAPHTYKNTTLTWKARASTLVSSNATDIGSLEISDSGQLSALAYGTHLVAPGDYCVVALLL